MSRRNTRPPRDGDAKWEDVALTKRNPPMGLLDGVWVPLDSTPVSKRRKTQRQPKRLGTVCAVKVDLASPPPWTNGLSPRERERFRDRGVDLPALFQEFFGRWTKRDRLSPTERSLWKALTELVALRAECDRGGHRSLLERIQAEAVRAVKQIVLPTRGPIRAARPEEIPKKFRGKKHIRAFVDDSGRLSLSINWLGDFPSGGRPKGETEMRRQRKKIAATYRELFPSVHDYLSTEDASQRDALLGAMPAPRAALLREALAECEGSPITAGQITLTMLSMAIQKVQGGSRLAMESVRRLASDAEAEKGGGPRIPGPSPRPVRKPPPKISPP